MSITKRQERILELLRSEGFLSVLSISEITYTSPSSIRRDLARLENMNLIKRTHGGASVLNEINQSVPLNRRMTKNTVGKRKIAKKAELLLKDGQTIMLDGSSTASFLIPYIAKFKNTVLFTNNMMTAINAINYGIKTHCIGGASVNGSAVLSGTESYEAVAKIHPDLLFFSSKALSDDGVISDPTSEENYLRSLMIKNAKIKVFLCDSEKFSDTSIYTLTTLDEIDYAIFDEPYDNLKTSCKII